MKTTLKCFRVLLLLFVVFFFSHTLLHFFPISYVLADKREHVEVSDSVNIFVLRMTTV